MQLKLREITLLCVTIVLFLGSTFFIGRYFLTKNTLLTFSNQDVVSNNTSTTTSTINLQKTYQTMIGFGNAYLARFDEPHMLYLKGRGEPKDTVPAKDKQEILSYIYDDLGLDTITIQVRKYLSPSYDGWKSWEPQNDNELSQVLDSTKLKFDKKYWDGLFDIVKIARTKIIARGATPILTVKASWGVEDWMASPDNKNKIKDGFEDEYAEWLVEGLLYIKDTYGIEPDYVTVTNEPDGPPAMTSQQMAKVIRYLGPLLKKYNLATGISAPESFLPKSTPEYLRAILADPEVAAYVKLVAFHIYDRDVYAGANGDMGVRNDIVSLTKKLNAQIIIGEVSLDPCCKKNIDTLYKDSYSGALAFANDFYNELTVSNVSGIDMQLPFWTSQDPSAYVLLNFDADSNYINYSLSKYYYPLRQFIKYIKQGMVRVDIQSNDPQIQPVAFFDQKSGQFVIIIINNGTNATQFSTTFAQGAQLPKTLVGTRSSQTENGVATGTITAKQGVFTIQLQPKSITTYTGTLKK